MKKLAVVTGGTKGIGRAIIEKFASNGFHILTCARNETNLKELKQEIETINKGIELNYIVADLSKKGDTENFVSFVTDSGIVPDLLVNNTGIFLPGQIHSEEEGTLESMMNTNLYSAYRVTRGIIKSMIEKKAGHVFNICSIASIMAYPNGGSYSITKYALYGMTRCLREEMKPFNIKVTAVLPGATYTASWEGVDLPKERFIQSEDVADAVWGVFSLSNNSVVEEIVIRPQLGDIG